MRRFLERLALFARHRYRLVFTVFAVLVALSVLLITRLSFDTDMLNLLPRKNPVVSSYIETLQDFGSQSFLLVTVDIPEGAVLDPYESLADDLAGRLAKVPELRNVQHRIGDPAELLQTFFPKSLLFLDAKGRERLAAKLRDDAIRQRVSELRRQLSTPQGMAIKQLSRLDPLGLAEVFLGRLESSRGTLNVDWTSGYYISRDHRLLLILAEPVKPPQDIPFTESLAAHADKAIAESLARWGEIAGPDRPRPAVKMGGPHLTAVGDAGMIRTDMLVNIVTSALGVFVLFLFIFRRAGALLYAFVPLLCGLVLTFAFAALAFGKLSSATSVVAALLIGLGIDFVIVSYGRYVEERRGGANLEEGLAAMLGGVGGAVMAGAMTTAATFYAFTFTEFTGLRQLGLLTGTGILLCMISVLILLPAMLAWGEDRRTSRKKEPNLYLHSFGTNRLTGLCMRHPVAALLTGLVVTLATLALASRLQFDESMKTMRPNGNRGIDVAAEVGKRFGSGFDSMIVVLSGDSLEEVLELSDQAAAGAKGLVDEGILYGFSGATSLIPPERQQKEALDWLARERAGEGDLNMERIRATFAKSLAAEGLRLEPFEPGLDLLDKAVSLSQPIGLADFAGQQQTKLLLDRYVTKTDHGWRAAVYLYPPANRWRREAPPQALRMVERLGPHARLNGVNLVNQTVRTMVLRDAWIAGLLGFALVTILLWIDFRNLRDVLLALMPLLVGITLMMGGMVLLDIQMNFINIFVTTMIIGIGVDYGIYILHRYHEVKNLDSAESEEGLRETGKAVAAAAVSTIVGFGSIIFSHYPGLRSTGKVAILGAFFTSMVAVMLLPAFLSWRDRRRRGSTTPSS